MQSLETVIEYSQGACLWAYGEFRAATGLRGKYVNTWDIAVNTVAIQVLSKKYPKLNV